MVSTHAAIQKSPFKNVYWFSRWLLNTDQFGALGKAKERQLLELVAVLENLSVQENFSAGDKSRLLKNILLTEIPNMASRGTKAHRLALNLVQQLDEYITTAEDVLIFCAAMKYVVAPINRAIMLVPSDDKNFCETAAKNILDTFGEEKIAALIATWDDLGVKGCLDAERAIVVEEFMRLIENLSALKIPHSKLDDNLILTAFVQEFERRLGQKRKARGGAQKAAHGWAAAAVERVMRSQAARAARVLVALNGTTYPPLRGEFLCYFLCSVKESRSGNIKVIVNRSLSTAPKCKEFDLSR